MEYCTSLTVQVQVLGATMFPAWVFAWDSIFSWMVDLPQEHLQSPPLLPLSTGWWKEWNTIVQGSMTFFSAFGAPAHSAVSALDWVLWWETPGSPDAPPALFQEGNSVWEWGRGQGEQDAHLPKNEVLYSSLSSHNPDLRLDLLLRWKPVQW